MGILSAFRFAFQNLFFTPILYGVIASLAVFSTVWDKGDRLKDQLTDGFRSQEDTFDFIIVGGGVAGSVLANRLSQYHTVLLLEAGGETHPFQAIPGLSLFIPKNPGTDWSHKTITQTKSCLACPQKKYILSQGRNLGSNIDYMMYLRGNPLDFNNWATITGDPSWGYEGVLPYFIQSENFVGETSDKSAHGYGGPLQIQIPDYIGLADEWNLAGVEMGYPHVDLNGRHSEGFDTVFYPIKHGVRQATYRAYIKPVRNRKSLLIRKFAHVNKVLIKEGNNGVAHSVGVVYDRHGQSKHAFANKEVILSAGTLQTPKLLILSGVGQLEHLKALHVPVRSILPVGDNLQDHFSTLLGPFYINKPKTISFDRDIDKNSFASFAATGTGPLSSTGFQATAMLTSSIALAQGQVGWPDIQLTLFGLTPHRMFYSDIGHAFGIRQDILHRYYGDVSGKENAFFIFVTVTRPISKGSYCVSRNDPYKPPVIDPNYIMDHEGQDVRVMVEGIHRALFLAENTTVFRGLETQYSPKCFPGCEKFLFRSEDYWECYIRQYSIAMNHHVGTCPMGKLGSPYAVVDPQLQVQGIDGLRVVDASVMPTIVGAPTQAATVMIAEKASALILDKWKHDAKTLYGAPGTNPGPPLTEYGPPIQYGPPGNNHPGYIIQQYGAPGPVGDGFSNYDSFSLIQDQLNPTTGGLGGAPRPTPLIPLIPDPQVWATPPPFPNYVTAKPAFISGISSTPDSLLTPEPVQVLVPPGQLPAADPGLNYATSYSTTNIDFSGPSTTPDYSSSFSFDTARSSSDNNGRADTQVTDDGNTTNTGRQGKSFGDDAEAIVIPPEGNQLGQGTYDDELLVTSATPTTSIPTYFSSAPTTLQTYTSQSESKVINQGPGYRVIRKRIRTTPRVVVHPRGHLGHQNVERKIRKKLNESLEMLFLTTSSVRPVPKDIVKIRRRRPVPYRYLIKTTTTTTSTVPPTTSQALPEAADDVEGETMAYSDNFDYTTTGAPPTEIPELRSPERKRFVRRMYSRPLNFNGKNKRWTGRSTNNDYIAQATAHIIVTMPPTTTNSPAAELENEELEPDKEYNVEEITDYPSYKEDNINEESQIDEKTNQEEVLPVPPVVVFRNIELEDTEELTRNSRSHVVTNSTSKTGRKSNYFEYNVVPAEESKNPIMLVDLNPEPEILAPNTLMEEAGKEGQHETVAIMMGGIPAEEDGRQESTTSTNEYYYDANDQQEEAPNISDQVSSIGENEEIGNKSSAINNILHIVSQVDSDSNLANNSSNVKITVVVSSSSSSNSSINDDSSRKSSGGNKPLYKRASHNLLRSTSTTTTDATSTTAVPESIFDDDGDDEDSIEVLSTSTIASITTKASKTNPRYNFRMRNKLIRTHS